jgi:hypothetical protein
LRIPNLLCLLFVASMSAATDDPPAELKADYAENSFSYQVVNKSPYRITEFEVLTTWREGDVYFSCGVHRPDVRSGQDLFVSALAPYDPAWIA